MTVSGRIEPQCADPGRINLSSIELFEGRFMQYFFTVFFLEIRLSREKNAYGKYMYIFVYDSLGRTESKLEFLYLSFVEWIVAEVK